MWSFDDLIKPRAKSAEDYSDVLDLINLFGSHLRFGEGSKGSQSHRPPSLHESIFFIFFHQAGHSYFVIQLFFFFLFTS